MARRLRLDDPGHRGDEQAMAKFWLELSEGRREIRTPLDMQRALWECPSLAAEGALAAACRWDCPAGLELGAKAIMDCLRECGRRAEEFSPLALGRLSTGQVLYLVIASAVDGLTEDQVLTRAAARLTGETMGGAAYVLRWMVERGYVQHTDGMYCAPGPVAPTWSQL